MHDIICPNCGELFLGYDVAFDMSEYVLPLLYGNTKDEDAVRQVKFKYYVDEETIIKSNPMESPELLQCANPGGPGYNDQVFSFILNGKTLYDYVFSKSGFAYESEFDSVLEQLKIAVEENNFSKITPLNLSQISTIYHLVFGVSNKLVGDISTSDEYVRTAIKVLVYIYDNRYAVDQSNSLDLKVCLYSANHNGIAGYHVPDILFVKIGGIYERIKKCCRFCGRELPMEFGYYKMKPVVLLGSHAAGKTSYLLSLLNTVLAGAPFITSPEIATTTLTQDFNLTAFMKNIERFRLGLAPEKTDFQNVPILNLKVKDTIYSFIDWPGEKFISGVGTDNDYIYKSRRVITRARHVMFFLPPEQVDASLPFPEENVRFEILDLGQSLSWHISFPDKKRFASLTYVVNKVDVLRDRQNAESIFDGIQNLRENDIYSGSWQESKFQTANQGTINYIVHQNPALFGVLNNQNVAEKYFIPVAPYGYDAPKDKKEDDNSVILRGYLSGLPFLRILKTDKIIK